MKTTNINKYSERILKTLLVVSMVLAMFYAGRCDYNEEVLVLMSQKTYEAICTELGTTDESRVVREYMSNREKWEQYDKQW
jgi:hypothetical protein